MVCHYNGNKCQQLKYVNMFFPILALPKNLPTVAMMEKIQLERKNLLKQKCSELKLKSKTSPRPVRFKIEDRHRVMYCEVPKVINSEILV